MREVDEPYRLGRYEILRPLARGGMAELFLARATGIQGFEKLVVVKRILPEMARDTDYVEMFLEEARLAAGLHHSNIVQVYDIGEDEAAPFFAMEYLHGEDVRTLLRAAALRRARVPVEHALSIAIGVAAGLHHAHEKRDPDGRPLGIVHRDVSPHNVAVTFDGGVKLLDFGVAKTRRRASATRHGTLKGKLGYMSPEQCRGDELDRRSDVFAVAILLWELLDRPAPVRRAQRLRRHEVDRRDRRAAAVAGVARVSVRARGDRDARPAARARGQAAVRRGAAAGARGVRPRETGCRCRTPGSATICASCSATRRS